MMTNEFQNGVAKTKAVFSDATEAVAERAKEGSTTMNKFLHLAMQALPATSARLLDAMIARVGLERRSSGLAGVGMFIGGFAAGSVVTAFATPVSGPELRKRVRALAGGLIKDVEPVAVEVAKEAHELKAAARSHARHTGSHNGKKSNGAHRS